MYYTQFFQSHSQSLHTHCPSSLTQSLRTQLCLRSQAPSLFKHSCLILSFFTLSFQSHSVSSHTVTCQSFQSHPVRLFTDSCPSSLTQSLHTVTCPRSSLTLSVSSVTNSPLNLTQSLLTQLLSFQSHTQSLHTQLSFTRARARARTHTHTHTHTHTSSSKQLDYSQTARFLKQRYFVHFKRFENAPYRGPSQIPVLRCL